MMGLSCDVNHHSESIFARHHITFADFLSFTNLVKTQSPWPPLSARQLLNFYDSIRRSGFQRAV
jgi:hypothetical protein